MRARRALRLLLALHATACVLAARAARAALKFQKVPLELKYGPITFRRFRVVRDCRLVSGPKSTRKYMYSLFYTAVTTL
jgi:hypothetical protein